LIAPYTLKSEISNYAVEAIIKVTGLNGSHPYTKGIDPEQEPFFKLYVRGDGLNSQGYMAGLNGIPSGQPNGSYSTLVAIGQNLVGGRIFYQRGDRRILST
jgi:hypothetical protein